jgi:CubicO group peptidase (beta-lactamase class C family)
LLQKISRRTPQLRKMIALACAVFLISTTSASAQQATGAAAAPSELPVEAAKRAVLLAINGGPSDRAALAQSAFSAGALANESAGQRLAWLNKLAADSQGLELISSMAQGDRMVEAIVKTRRGAKFGKLVIFTSSKEPRKISNLFLLPARDPAKVRREAWPKEKVSVPRIADEIGKHAEALAAEGSLSGAVLVARGRQVVFRRAFGLADREWRIANRPETLFHLGSIGKMFTAAAILKLADQGRVSLDDSLSKWVPEYPHPEAAKITLGQLLTHSAGIGEWDQRQVKHPMTGAEMAAAMIQPLEFTPGQRFSYSNSGFILLQAVIEKATGDSFADALSELIFKPAEMAHSGLWPVTAVVPGRATGYLHREDDPLGLGPLYSNEQLLGYAGNGSGGEYSTVDDMAAFLRALKGGRLLSPKMTEEMLAPRIDMAGASRPAKYGYGVERGTCNGHPMFGHEGGGANSGVSSLAYAMLDKDWLVIVLSNSDPPAAGDLAMSICEFVAGQ